MPSRIANIVLAVALLGCGASSTERDDAGVDAGPPPAPWAVSLPGYVQAVAADGAGRVYAMSGGTLHAFAPEGVFLWERSGGVDGPSNNRHGLVGIDHGVIAVQGADVVRFGPDGEEIWRDEGVYADVAALATHDDVVAVLRGGSLTGYAVEDGVERWRAEREHVEDDAPRESILAAVPDGGWVVTPPLVAYGPTGEQRWEQPIPARAIHGLAVANDGAILVTGVYDYFGSADFGLGPLPTPSNFDPYVAIFDADGTIRTSLSFAGPDFEYPYGAASDGARFFVAGHYGEFSNGIDIGDTSLGSAGGRDTFLAWLGTDGRIEEARGIHGDGDVVGRAAAWSPRGRWIVGGIFMADTATAGIELEREEGHLGYLWVGPE